MTAGDRFKGWVESVTSSWKDQVRGWLGRSIGEGVARFTESLEPGVKDTAREALTRIRNEPTTTPEMQRIIDRLLAEGNLLTTIWAELLIILQAIPVLLGGSEPLANEVRYLQDYVKRTYRMNPAEVITAWRRDPGKYLKLFDDLREQGWSDERLETLQAITEFLPSPRDLVEWEAKEVFEPAMIAKYGLDDEFETLDLSLFSKVGVTEEQARNFWRAHWEHASWNQVVEMLRRGQMTEQDVRDWFRLVEIPPFWRDRLMATSWEVPTRVDVRRFWDMRTIDEARMREIYTAQGYHGKDLDDYVVWTKVYTDFPTLMAQWKNGWITLEQVKQRLIELGMPADRAETMLQEKVKAEGATRTAAERDLTKSDIYKGVKMERISRLEGLELLLDLGYDENEASYLLDINVPSGEQASAVKQRELTKADVLSGLKAGIITELGARSMLLDLRYSAADVEFLLKLFRAQVEPPTELKLKEASKADIVLGVTRGLITPGEGHAMLLDLGYSPEAADFILLVKATESPFSPTNYVEFKDLAQRWRQGAGVGGKPMSEELKKAAALLAKVSAEVDALRRAVKEEEAKLVPDTAIPDTATVRLKELQVARNRAEAELARVQTDYNAKVAEWKHGL